jgi:hypothetical protein
MPINTGTRLGSYELAAQIGAGGMGEDLWAIRDGNDRGAFARSNHEA